MTQPREFTAGFLFCGLGAGHALRLVFRNTFAVGKKYRIPDLEMALVLKFVAMMSSTRDLRKKYIAEAIPEIEKLGLTVPDNLANRRYL